MDSGWVKLYRKLLEDVIWIKSTNEQRVILITLLLLANHSSREWEWEGKKFTVKPGQFITSIDSIVQACNESVTPKNVRTALAKFEKLGFLANQSTKTGRLITIAKWELYQSKDIDSGKDTGKEVADTGQTGGKQVATNKNDKNNKNEKKLVSTPELPLVDERIKIIQHYYESIIGGLISPAWMNEFISYVDGGLQVELIEKALLEVSQDRSKCNMPYIKAKLNGWVKDGVVTVERYIEEKERRKSHGKSKSRTDRQNSEPAKDQFEEYLDRKGIRTGDIAGELPY